MRQFHAPKYGLSACLGILLAVYMLFAVFYMVIGGFIAGVFLHRQSFHADLLWWPLPCIFPAGSALMAADVIRGVVTHRPVKPTLPNMVVSSMFLAIGSLFGLTSHNDLAVVAVIVSWAVAVAFVVCLISMRRRRGPAVTGGAE